MAERSRPTSRQGARPAARGSARTGTRTGNRAGSRPVSRPATTRAGASRPAAAARPRTAPPGPVKQSTAWVRGLILLTLVAMLAVAIGPTVANLFSQREQAQQLQATIAEQEQQLQTLRREAQLWKDPAYIETQARTRLQFVRVGDRAYTVLGAGATDSQQAVSPVVPAAGADANAAWYGRIWQSIELADQPAAGVSEGAATTTGTVDATTPAASSTGTSLPTPSGSAPSGAAR